MRYDEKGNLVVWENKDKVAFIPAKQVQVIRDNMNRGVEWPYCSPLYDITREQAAFIWTSGELKLQS